MSCLACVARWVRGRRASTDHGWWTMFQVGTTRAAESTSSCRTAVRRAAAPRRLSSVNVVEPGSSLERQACRLGRHRAPISTSDPRPLAVTRISSSRDRWGATRCSPSSNSEAGACRARCRSVLCRSCRCVRDARIGAARLPTPSDVTFDGEHAERRRRVDQMTGAELQQAGEVELQLRHPATAASRARAPLPRL